MSKNTPQFTFTRLLKEAAKFERSLWDFLAKEKYKTLDKKEFDSLLKLITMGNFYNRENWKDLIRTALKSYGNNFKKVLHA